MGRLLNSFLILALLIPIHPSAFAVVNPKENVEKSYTFHQITRQEKFVLTGINPTYTLELPISKQWKLNDVTLHLVISHSSVLNKSSTMTAQINNKPINTILLMENNSNRTWDITVPKELLNTNSLTLEILGFLRISDNMCADINNPGNWANISKNSIVKYQFNLLDFAPQLSQFPYPFIQKQSPEADINALVLPNNLSSQSLNHAFYVSSILGAHATWRGLMLNTMSADELINNINRPNYNTIIIGTAQQLSLQKLSTQWPLQISPDGKFKGVDGKDIPANTGVIMLIPAPWNAKLAVLAITGETETGVANAALALNSATPLTLSDSNYALISEQPTPKADINWDSFTLKALGYNDKVIYGSGQHSLNYVIDLPKNRTPSSLKLKVNFGYSPFILSNQSISSLTLSVNGKPENGIKLMPGKSNRTVWELNIPKNNLTSGENTFDFNFDLHPDDKYCSPYFLTKTWGIIDANTHMSVKFDKQSPALSLSQFPTPFDTESIIALPLKESYNQKKIVEAVLNLAQQMKKNPLNISLLESNTISVDKLATQNIILIGNPNTNPMIATAMKSTNVKLPTKDQPFGLLQILPSPWNTKKVVMIIAAATDNEMELAFKLLTEDKTRGKLRGNTVIIYPDGHYIVSDSLSAEKKGFFSSWFR